MRSLDTDDAVLAICFSGDIPVQLYFRTGVKNRTRFIDLSLLVSRQSEAQCRALPGLHALTGCDSTSAFRGRAKQHALSIILDPNNVAARQAMVSLGLHFDASNDLAKQVERFVCMIYGSPHQTSVNEL